MKSGDELESRFGCFKSGGWPYKNHGMGRCLSDYSPFPFWSDDMPWEEPAFSRTVVDKAGFFLAKYYPLQGQTLQQSILHSRDDMDKAVNTVNNWRSSHDYPLNTFQMFLRRHAMQIDSKSLVAQRVKRLPAIVKKLRREGRMRLSRMQDIGGCRAILADVDAVERLHQEFIDSQMKHRLANEASGDANGDYIKEPKKDGYRGVHLTYRYQSTSESKRAYDSLRIEVQLRTRLQHAWATGVETVDAMTGQSLKTGVGKKSWKRFFALMSSYIAMEEGQPLVPGTPKREITVKNELHLLAKELQVDQRLSGYRNSQRSSPPSFPREWYLLESYPGGSKATGFTRRRRRVALQRYWEAEKVLRENGPGDAVLVSVHSMTKPDVNTVMAAYPNYFADTEEFLKLLKKALS